jgi:hypothetical protein
MSSLIGEFIEGAEELAGEAVAAVETVAGEAVAVFRPRPGGKIDTARRNAEQDSLAEQPVAHQDYLINGKPVAVDSLVPEIGGARTVTLDVNNPAIPLLPRDTTRRSALILAVDNDVYLSNDPGQAMTAANSGGATAEGVFYLPKSVPVPWQNTDQLWAAVTTTGTSSRISVMASFKGA